MDRKERIKIKKLEKEKLLASKGEENLSFGNTKDRFFMSEFRDVFMKSLNIEKPVIINTEGFMHKNYHPNQVVKTLNFGEYKVRFQKDVEKEIKSINGIFKSSFTNTMESFIRVQNVKLINGIRSKLKLNELTSFKELGELFASESCEFNKDFIKEITPSNLKIKEKYSTWLFKIKNNTKDVLRSFITDNEPLSQERLDTVVDPNVFISLPDFKAGFGGKVIETANEKLKFFNVYCSKESDGTIVYNIESKFGLTFDKFSNENLHYSVGYIPQLNNSTEDFNTGLDTFMASNVENAGKDEIEVDLSKPYMALSAAIGLSLRNPKETRVVNECLLSSGLFTLTCLPLGKNEMKRSFGFTYSAKFPLEFIERMRTVNNPSKKDLALLSYEFGRVLAYFTALLNINPYKFPQMLDLVSEVKLVLFELANIIMKFEEDKEQEYLGSSKLFHMLLETPSKGEEVDMLDNGAWQSKPRLNREFISNIDDLYEFYCNTYNKVSFRKILNLSYTAMHYIILGLVPMKMIDNTTSINDFIMSCKKELIKEWLDKGNVSISNYESAALYGLFYTYYKIRDFYNLYSMDSISVSLDDKKNYNHDVFFNSVYKFGYAIETDLLSYKEEGINYLTEILNNELFDSKIRLLDILSFEKVYYSNDDIVFEHGINVPSLLVMDLTKCLDPFQVYSEGTDPKTFGSAAYVRSVKKALGMGIGESFDVVSMENYIMNSIATTDWKTVSPYKIYKIVSIASFCRYLMKELNNFSKSYNELSNIVVSCDTLVHKLYEEWFLSNNTTYMFEDRTYEYDTIHNKKNKHEFIRSEIELIIANYIHFVEDLRDKEISLRLYQHLRHAYISHGPNMYDLITIPTVAPNTEEEYKEAISDFSMTILNNIVDYKQRKVPSVFTLFTNIIQNCKSDTNKKSIQSIIKGLDSGDDESTKNLTIDEGYQDIAYTPYVLKKILHNVHTILSLKDELSVDARLYLTFVIIYANIIRAHLNNTTIQPNTNIVQTTNTDDLMELGTSTIRSIESLLASIVKKISEETTKRDNMRRFY